MPEECIFCRIVAGDLPGRTVREDETTLSFLDANPLAPGHTLVVPKAHHERLAGLDDDLAADLYATLQRVVLAAESAVDADGANVGFNDGSAAGQEVPHVHGHVVPRFDGDGGRPIHAVAGRRPDLDDAELDDIAASIEDAL